MRGDVGGYAFRPRLGGTGIPGPKIVEGAAGRYALSFASAAQGASRLRTSRAAARKPFPMKRA